MTEPKPKPAPSSSDEAKEPPCTCEVDRKQTGACWDAQADGTPCADPFGRCEVCGRSVLDHSKLGIKDPD